MLERGCGRNQVEVLRCDSAVVFLPGGGMMVSGFAWWETLICKWVLLCMGCVFLHMHVSLVWLWAVDVHVLVEALDVG